MKKRLVFLLLLLVMVVLCGCGAKAKVDSAIGALTIRRITFETEYAGLAPDAGDLLCVVAMKANGTIDESRLRDTFCAEDGTNVATLAVDGGAPADCIAVGTQGNPKDEEVEYILIFKVPASAEKAPNLSLQVPGFSSVAIKGK